ncbi:DUF2497 domain-containing protein [Rhizobium sp. C1]|nr:DUF2497 domain-containing protein [Rhizobium sp. C1]MCD2176964.1 DUF2497 domain-containing protein [Rhizobium sp. C1]
MAQPNVAREPSMEEILASIRRIIENNDPVESVDNVSYSAQAPSAPETIELTIDEDIALMAAGADFTPARVAPVQATESVSAPRAPEKAEQPAARPMSLADVAARVKAASERRQPAAPANDTERQAQAAAPAPAVKSQPVLSHPVEAQPVQAEFVQDQTAASPVITQQRYEQPVDAFADVSATATAATASQNTFFSEVQAPASTYETEESAMNRFDMMDETVEPVVEADDEVSLDPIERFAAQIGNEIAAAVPAQLLSPVTEEKVSRSFEELADALGGSKRSLDEIAEEMLKPMLQEWLDDNLPMMVERLVREEIERVARGPRR